MMNEMLRNGSGYVDMTAYEGMTKANPGEIWTQADREDDYWLLIAVNGKVATGLKLTNRECDGSIPVICREVMYTNPAMLGYLFFNRLGYYVKSVPKKEFETVQKAVSSALGFTFGGNGEIDEIIKDSEELKKQLNAAQADLRISETVRQALNESNKMLEDELDSCKPYREMYNELLDKLIAKVGVAL